MNVISGDGVGVSRRSTSSFARTCWSFRRLGYTAEMTIRWASPRDNGSIDAHMFALVTFGSSGEAAAQVCFFFVFVFSDGGGGVSPASSDSLSDCRFELNQVSNLWRV